ATGWFHGRSARGRRASSANLGPTRSWPAAPVEEPLRQKRKPTSGSASSRTKRRAWSSTRCIKTRGSRRLALLPRPDSRKRGSSSGPTRRASRSCSDGGVVRHADDRPRVLIVESGGGVAQREVPHGSVETVGGMCRDGLVDINCGLHAVAPLCEHSCLRG